MPSHDDQLIDEVLDRALELIEEGQSVDIDALIGSRTDLRARAHNAVRLARSIAVTGAREQPTVGGYSIVSELGSGGMGTVYLARQEKLGDRLIALKVLPRLTAMSERARERFMAEAQALARLRHPNVVAVHDVVFDDDVCAYAMEWIDGKTLGQVIGFWRTDGGGSLRAFLDPDTEDDSDDPRVPFVVRLGIAIGRALDAVHAAGFVHRDVKPSNVLLRRDGTPLLSDFGLVRETDTTVHTQAGRFVGTLAYAAPEQLRGDSEAIDARSDVYALGALLYHALTLEVPFGGATVSEILKKIDLGGAPPMRRLAPRLPRDLETIVAKAMDADPARRYPSAGEMAADLQRTLDLQPIEARRAGPVARLAKSVRRHRVGVLSALAGAVLVLVVVGLGQWRSLRNAQRVELAVQSVREAHEALLSPDQGDRIFRVVLGMADEFPDDSDGGWSKALGAALKEYDKWKSALPPDTRLERETVAVALQIVMRGAIEIPAMLAERAPITAAYASDWRSGLPPEAAPESSRALPADRRCLGLLAFLCGQTRTALDIWSHDDDSEDHDPFVSAALGQLHLSRERADLALPHVLTAYREYSDFGFICVNLADVTVQLGQLDRARSLLERAENLDGHDKSLTLVRVWADYSAAIGEDEEAERRYTSLFEKHQVPNARDHYARFLIRRGKLREAVQVYARLLHFRPWVPEYQRRFMAATDLWWASLDVPMRYVAVYSVVGGDSFVRDTLKRYEACFNELGVGAFDRVGRELTATAARWLDVLEAEWTSEPRGPFSSDLFMAMLARYGRAFDIEETPPDLKEPSALTPWDPAAYLQRATLFEMTHRTEISAMNTIQLSTWRRSGPWLRHLLTHAWLSRTPQRATRGVDWMNGRVVAVASLVAALMGSTAHAQWSYSVTMDGASSMISGRANLGDVDLDGIPDVAVRTGPSVSVVSGISLFGSCGPEIIRSIPGDDPSDGFGASFVPAGDVNDDGYPDLLVGANLGSPGGCIECGYVQLVSGRHIATGEGEAVLYERSGHAAGDRYGWAVDVAGDVNGDGWIDFIVGAYQRGNGGPGYAEVLSGRFVDTGEGDQVLCGAGVLKGATDDDSYGFGVSGIGDIDFDGRDDFAIGAVFHDPGGIADAGCAYVYSGQGCGLLVTIPGTFVNERFGFRMSRVGDVDGDSVEDLAIGADERYSVENARGTVRVYSGASLASPEGVETLCEVHGSVYDIHAFVNYLGDANGDGTPEFLVGARQDADGHFGTGYVNVYDPAEQQCLPPVDYFEGEMNGDRFGVWCSGAGDIDSDGVPDIVVVAPGRGAYFYLSTGPEISPGDFDEDGAVAFADLLHLLASWGDCDDCADCPADLDCDCTVGFDDLLILLSNWG